MAYQIDQRKTEIGKLTEEIVAAYFRSIGSSVEESIDKFDSSKDMLVDGKTVEVKFQTIFFNFKSFTTGKTPVPAFTISITQSNGNVAQNQLDKVLNADRWIVLQNPSDKLNEKTIKLWEAPCVGKRRFGLAQNSRDRRVVAGFPLAQFKLLYEFENEKLYRKIKSLDTSKYS